jgi:alpha 1,3-glucosidase
MILANGIAGYPFAGADVGGFFGNPDKDLLTRWYQAGAFYPFFRAHAHIDTRRREPYLLGEPYTSIITQAIRLRYQLLPAWYTAFHEASAIGAPILRPHYYVFPGDEKGFALDDQFFVGATGLLAKPVVTEDADKVDIYIPDEENYYDYFDYTRYSGAGTKSIPAPLEKIPIFMQGGHIIPRRDRPRRSSGLMKWDPFTLVVVLNKAGDAEGTLYLDDGQTFDYQAGAFIHRRFIYSQASSSLFSENLAEAVGAKTAAYLKTMKKVRVEKIIIVGVGGEWASRKEVSVSEEGKQRKSKVIYHRAEGGKAAWAVIRDPKVAVENSWRIDFA